MRIKYFEAPDIKKLVEEIVDILNLTYVEPRFIYCLRSVGSKSRRIIARIHGLGKVWQITLQIPPAYVIEVLSERFDKLNEDEKEKVLIHELLHIPKGFAGGFRPHKGYIDRKIVEKLHFLMQKHKRLRTM